MIIYLFEAIHLFFRSSAFNEASTLSLFVLSLKVLIVLVKVVSSAYMMKLTYHSLLLNH